MDLNKTEIIGRLTQDAVLEYTAGGSAVAKFSIAFVIFAIDMNHFGYSIFLLLNTRHRNFIVCL